MTRSRILVIDPDATSRSRLALFLRKSYLVFVASEGIEAYSKAVEHPPDLVILRVPIPDVEGLDTLRRFRSGAVTNRIPFVILSGDPRRDSVMEAIAAGAADYVLEFDLNLHQFEERLRRLLNPGISAPANSLNPPHNDRSPLRRSPPQTAGAIHQTMESAEVQTIIDQWE